MRKLMPTTTEVLTPRWLVWLFGRIRDRCRCAACHAERYVTVRVPRFSPAETPIELTGPVRGFRILHRHPRRRQLAGRAGRAAGAGR